MTRHLLLPALVFALTIHAEGQDILHYKFESGAGGSEINYGDPTPGIPAIGQIVANTSTPIAQAWTAGKFGTGLAAAPVSPGAGYELDTGWDCVVGSGQDVTLGFFFRMTHPIPSNNFAAMCGPIGNLGESVKLQISSVPGTVGYITLTWTAGGSGSTSVLAQDLMTPAFSNWVHVAVVINRSGSASCQTATVQWFVNGVPQVPQAPGGCWHNLSGSSAQSFRFGDRHDGYFRYDDWRLYLRAVPASEILQWATTDLAADAPFGDACHPFGLPVLLWGSGGNPTPGNGSYQLTVYGLPGSAVSLGIGLSDTSFSGSALPLNLGTVVPALSGCQLRTSVDMLLSGTIGATGSLDFPTPIPSLPSFIGLNAYAQAVLYSSILGAWSSTNAWAVHIGS